MIKYLIDLLFYWIAKIPKRNNEIWLFGAWFGYKYTDNSMALYEYSKKKRHSHCFWITKNKDLLKKIDGGLYCYSIRGIYLQLTASKFILCQDKDDFYRPLLTGRARIIQLWHGAPMKKIGNDAYRVNKNKNIQILRDLKKTISIFLMPWKKEIYHLMTASSDYDKKIFEQAFNIVNNNIQVTGYPRNDVILNRKTKQLSNKILYAPTFRGVPNSEFDLFRQYNFEKSRLTDFLIKENLFLDIKFHPAHKLTDYDEGIVNLSERITIIQSSVDINTVLSDYSILITDYSSIYIDYLLVGGKIILSQFDLNDYLAKSRDSYIDFSQLPSVGLAKNWPEIVLLLSKVIKDIGDTNSSTEYDYVRKKYHSYVDGKSSARVYEKIMELKNEKN